MEEVCKSQTRVIIRVCVSDIPGEIGRRPNTLGQKFCSQILHRDFKKEIELSGFDSIHIPPGFDSTEPVSRWFVYDLNVKGELDKDAVKAIPHFVYFASLVNEKWLVSPENKSSINLSQIGFLPRKRNM